MDADFNVYLVDKFALLARLDACTRTVLNDKYPGVTIDSSESKMRIAADGIELSVDLYYLDEIFSGRYTYDGSDYIYMDSADDSIVRGNEIAYIMQKRAVETQYIDVGL